MIETVIAVLVISLLFLSLFKLSYMLTGKVLLEHAAMRVARARAVGLNDYLCRKAARVATIPIAGRRLWPEGDELDDSMELARTAIYMATPDESVARGVLEYEGWGWLTVTPGDGGDSKVEQAFDLFDGTMKFSLEGEAGVERNWQLYMNGGGR